MAARITVQGVCKGFHRAGAPLPVVDRFTLTVGEGEVVALLGPSGCGKSTLLDLIAGFAFPDQGEIRHDGRAVLGPSPDRILLSQRGSVFPWLTARRNLTIVQPDRPVAERRHRAFEYLRLVGLRDADLAYPTQLSGGMRQRLELARALVVEPAVLLMDEPFGALDALTRMTVRAEFLGILQRQRHTVILVTHDVDEALHLADRIAVLTPRPARLQSILEVPAAHPRDLTSGPLTALKASILRDLGMAATVLGAPAPSGSA